MSKRKSSNETSDESEPLETTLKALRSSSEFRGPVEPVDDHEHVHENNHFALIYESQEEQFAAAIPFIRQGLERGERCLYITYENTREEVLAAMRDYGIDVAAALDSGQLSIHDEQEAYLRNETFDADETVEFIDAAIEEATKEYEALRMTGEMSSVLTEDPKGEELVRCEAKANYLFEDADGIALCQYNRSRFPSEAIRDVISTHPLLVHNERVSHNVYYTPPEEFFGPEKPDREVDRLLGSLQEQTDVKAELQRGEQYLRESYEITSDPTQSFEEKLDALFDLGCERFGLDFGFLNRVDTDADQLEVEYASDDHEHYQVGGELPLSETYCQAAVDIEEATTISDPTEQGFDDLLVYEEFGVDGYLGTYIPVEGDADRTLAFIPGESQSVSISKDDRTYLELLGQWIGYELNRRQRERELRERTEHLNALIETTPECIKTVASDGTLLQMNPPGLEMVEADSASDVTGECVYDLIAPEHRERFREFNERICEGERGTLEFDIIGLDGTRRHMESHAAPLQRPDGTTVQVALTRDVTEQKERERELERALDLLDRTDRIADVGGWEINVDTKDVFWTDHLFEMLEVDADEGPPLKEALDMYHEADQPIVEDAVENALESGESFDEEVRIRTDSGEIRWLRLQGVPETVDDNVVSIRGAAQDITEQREREAEFRQTKNRFETVFKQSDDAIYLVDTDVGEFVDANPAACEKLGYTREELLSMRLSDLHPDEMEQVHAFVDEVREQGSAWTENLQCRTKHGEDIPAEVTASTVTLDGQSLVLANIRYIEERKKHERYQRELHEIIADPQAAFDEKIADLLQLGRDRFGLDIGYFNRIDDDMVEIAETVGDHELLEPGAADPISESYCGKVLASSGSIAVSNPAEAGWTDDDTAYETFGFNAFLGTAITVGGEEYGTLCFASETPRQKPFTDAEQTFLDLMGELVSYELERQHRERFLRESHRITSDPELDFDEKLEQLLDLGRERMDLDAAGLTHLPSWDDKFHNEYTVGYGDDTDDEFWTDPSEGCYCREAIESDEPVGMADVRGTEWEEDEIHQEHGLTCYLGTKVMNGSTPYGTLWVGSTEPRDREFTETERTFLELIGQWVSYELERNHREQALEESNERLEQFAYAASHDLQEPLRMVSSYLQLLENQYGDAFDEDGEEYLEFAVDGADRMREMIDGLLAYSRVEARGDPFESVELDAVLDDVLEDLQIQIEETDAEITVEELPRVEGDGNQLRQVFQNLLENAITYTGSSSPRVRIDAKRRKEDWVISVHDNGIGIDPEDQDRIFDIFDRLHSRDEYGGTGLGLALCQRIVERHDGEMWVDSEPGEGSTFSFRLPAVHGQ